MTEVDRAIDRFAQRLAANLESSAVELEYEARRWSRVDRHVEGSDAERAKVFREVAAIVRSSAWDP
jgi:hypothetical protein